MTMQQNQGSGALPNVLHDQGVPNTLDGVGLPRSPARFGVVGVAIAAALAGLVALLAVLTGRAQ